MHQKKTGTEIDALVAWGSQQCLIEHETHWKSLSLPIMQIYRVYDLLRLDSDLSPSCVFITHAPIHKYDVDSNPITEFAQYAQACESLFDKSKWAIVNIWEKNFDWRLEKIEGKSGIGIITSDTQKLYEEMENRHRKEIKALRESK